MIILSLLGMSLREQKSRYSENIGMELFNFVEGDYINSTDALLQNFDVPFIFFGTKESIEKHKKVFDPIIHKKKVEFIEYESHNLNDIFYKIIQVLINHKNEEILFDITHSFRDAVLMSVLSTITTQAVYNPSIHMIYAKEIKKYEKYRYELVSDNLLNTSNIALVLSSFLDTLRVPKINSKYGLSAILQEFSVHLLSNQFKIIYEQDIPKIKKFINEKKAELSFLSPLLGELENFIADIEKTENMAVYEQFIFFASLFANKSYYLQASTYLTEAIIYYIAYVFKEKGYYDFEDYDYTNMRPIRDLLSFTYSNKHFNFPNDYFIDANYQTIMELRRLREDVNNIRNDLAHINIRQEYDNIDESIENAIERLKEFIKTGKLYDMDKNRVEKTKTIDYQKKKYRKEFAKFVKANNSVPKFDTIMNRYKDRTLHIWKDKLDHRKLEKYIRSHWSEIEKILDAEKAGRQILD